MNKYVIIDFIGKCWTNYKDEISLGFGLDYDMDKYINIGFNIIVKSYNNGKVYVIKEKESE